jgi:hypothetical protein
LGPRERDVSERGEVIAFGFHREREYESGAFFAIGATDEILIAWVDFSVNNPIRLLSIICIPNLTSL